ncbi:hypothetical protein NPIL_47471 [Nephila pilipes]|uniref:Uncharacterized protein n=1 Tax=Nephila pilipes TaxID=299642 RepID=A0A8X6MZS8_NEPPI|nr:hypothetical protein NPIL_47471 [Nephila pilipes]
MRLTVKFTGGFCHILFQFLKSGLGRKPFCMTTASGVRILSGHGQLCCRRRLQRPGCQTLTAQWAAIRSLQISQSWSESLYLGVSETVGEKNRDRSGFFPPFLLNFNIWYFAF